MSFKTISVIGLGYIGLPTAAMFASRNKEVIGVDVSEHAVNTINQGNLHIVEPELDVIVKDAVRKGFLRATTSPQPADAFLISVPTPLLPLGPNSSTPQPDLSHIKSASKAIAKVLKKGNLIILESTSPVGTTEQMAAWLAEERKDLTFPQTHGDSSDIRIVYCPERVLTGNAVSELVENDRVIGGMTKNCSKAAIEVYKIFLEGECLVTDARTAEMAKLTENASRDVSIAFANELSIICDKLDIDVWELIRLANHHPRVDILQPGPGVGGHCIAVDPWFIVANSNVARLIQQSREVNLYKTEYVFKKLEKEIKNILSKKEVNEKEITVAFFGIAFKANIDDLRGSPALEIVKKTIEFFDCSILIVEPNIQELPNDIKNNSNLVSLSDGIKNCDIAISLVDHKEFTEIKKLDFNGKILIDSKGIWN